MQTNKDILNWKPEFVSTDHMHKNPTPFYTKIRQFLIDHDFEFVYSIDRRIVETFTITNFCNNIRIVIFEHHIDKYVIDMYKNKKQHRLYPAVLSPIRSLDEFYIQMELIFQNLNFYLEMDNVTSSSSSLK